MYYYVTVSGFAYSQNLANIQRVTDFVLLYQDNIVEKCTAIALTPDIAGTANVVQNIELDPLLVYEPFKGFFDTLYVKYYIFPVMIPYTSPTMPPTTNNNLKNIVTLVIIVNLKSVPTIY